MSGCDRFDWCDGVHDPDDGGWHTGADHRFFDGLLVVFVVFDDLRQPAPAYLHWEGTGSGETGAEEARGDVQECARLAGWLATAAGQVDELNRQHTRQEVAR